VRNPKVKPPQTISIHLKMKDRKVKQVLSSSGYQWEGGRVNGEGKGGYFEYVYKN
jgi:hypothetical protein